jgi:CBS domain-containing protein
MQRHIVPDIVSAEQQYSPVDPQMSVLDAARLMAEKRIGAVMVMEKGQLIGIFSERDLLNRVVAKGLSPDATLVRSVMTPDPVTLGAGATAQEALDLMQSKGFRHLPVVEGDRVLAICSIRDFFAAVNEELAEDLKTRDEILFGAGYGA